MVRHLLHAVGVVGVMTLSVSAQSVATVQAGKDLYAEQQCARCHMIGGRGYRHGKLDGVAKKMTAEEMRKWLTAPGEMEAKLDQPPKVKMSSRKSMKLDEADVSALIAYLMTLK